MSSQTHDHIYTKLEGAASALNREAVLRVVATVLTGLIFFLITLGGLVRNAGAGLSCPDWPLCFGRVVPPMNIQVFLEWFHRLIAGSVSTVLLGLSAFVFARKDLRKKAGRFCLLAIGLLMAQIVLGGLTVLGLLSPKWVSSHLAVGQAFFGTVLLLTLTLRDLRRPVAGANPQLATLRWLAPLAAAALYGQMILGGLVSSNYAGLACPDFPTCNGQWLPQLSGLVLFQFIHRLGAAVATGAIVILCLAAAGKNVSPRARFALRMLPLLLVAQIGLGVGSVLFQLPLPMSVAHLGTAAALFGMLLVTTYEVRRS